MPPAERQIDGNVPEESQQHTISRRALLKALAAAGGAVAATTLLPGEWAKPVVKVGVLPVHAQGSDPSQTPTPTATVAAPLAIITTCHAANVSGNPAIGPTDTIETYAEILPTTGGITLRRTITLNETGHPQNGVIRTDVDFTDALGRFQALNFDLGTISPTISIGVDRITILWEFVNSAEGTGTCSRNIEIA